MDTSALESAISTAEKSVDALYPWLFVATAVVVIGLVVEYWPDVKKLLSERPLDRKLMIEMIGGALVTIGVAGELMVQSYLSTAETTLRGADHKYSAELALRATTAENQIATTKAQTAQLQRDNLTLQKQVADAQKAAADAETEAEQVKARVIWRVLRPDQCATIVRNLPSGTGAIAIEYPLGDPEAVLFAITIENCFGRVAGWQVLTGALQFKDVLPINLSVYGPDATLVSDIERGLSAADIKFGTDVTRIKQGIVAAFGITTGPTGATILVGSRPLLPEKGQ